METTGKWGEARFARVGSLNRYSRLQSYDGSAVEDQFETTTLR